MGSGEDPTDPSEAVFRFLQLLPFAPAHLVYLPCAIVYQKVSKNFGNIETSIGFLQSYKMHDF
jgi:hypothetical protein